MQYTTIETLYNLFLECDQKICTDTRKIISGSIFFSLKGDNFNANTFASEALKQGCRYAIVDESSYADGVSILLVNNVLEILQQLATYHRNKMTLPVLAITGSNGKTTNKELITTVLSKKYNTLATVGNLNNHIGVPLTLLALRKEHEIAIIEMGANHQGEIDMLCKIANPDFGLITNIGKAHLEGFGGLEGVKKGKSELYKYIRQKGGKVFINADDEVLQSLAIDNDKITFGTNKLYDVIGKMQLSDEFVAFKWTTRYGDKDWNKRPEIRTKLVGQYNYSNLLCAACVGHYFKVDEEPINEALSSYEPTMNRSQLLKTEKNTLILDAYNANPTSMRAAIENFANVNFENKVVILGDMLELGDYSEQEHLDIIQLLQDKSIYDILLVGPIFHKLAQVKQLLSFETAEACSSYIKENVFEHKTILIKGSRGIKLETIKDVL